MTTVWNEKMIAREISRQTLARKCVVLVDNCSWPGSECDVLGVTTDLRIIDVEIKISRSDLKADAKKDKWWKSLTWMEKTAAGIDPKNLDLWNHRDPLEHPRKVWKHYYAIPADVWKPELLDCLPSSKSGVILLSQKSGGFIRIFVERRATPNKDADRLKPEQVMDIARLANLRMWDAYEREDRARQDLAWFRERHESKAAA